MTTLNIDEELRDARNLIADLRETMRFNGDIYGEKVILIHDTMVWLLDEVLKAQEGKR